MPEQNNIPDYMREGLVRYILRGTPPGGFMTSLLCNDLMGAFAQADSTNILRLADYAAFFWNVAPRSCFGSAENVSAWIIKRNETPLSAGSVRWPSEEWKALAKRIGGAA